MTTFEQPTTAGDQAALEDQQARAAACDPERSFLVEAPAGSGKTELLMQRYLRLLARVEQPEQVLAITFTVKAATEMRERILAALREAASTHEEVKQPVHRVATLNYAREALHNSEQLGWSILEQPGRLNIRTIDSLCGEITRRLPVLSGLGADLQPTEDADELYQQAARNTLHELGGPDAPLNAAIRTLLLHCENRMDKAARLLAQMLSKRDQWGGLLAQGGDLSDEALAAQIRDSLEAAITREMQNTLQRGETVLTAERLQQLLSLGKCGVAFLQEQNKKHQLHAFLTAPERLAFELDHLPCLKAAAGLLLTKAGSYRKKGDQHTGFTKQNPRQPEMNAMLASVREDENLRAWLLDVASLPDDTRYSEQEREVLAAVLRLLRRAVAHLKLLFVSGGVSDFVEVLLAARHALQNDANGLALAFGVEIQHLLIDEMQDTSIAQFELFSQMVESWDGHSQTVFLVGDPKQSIYRFRNSEVALFARARQQGLGGVRLHTLALRCNFRSRASLVAEANAMFTEIFGVGAHQSGIAFQPALAVIPDSAAPAVFWNPQIAQSGSSSSPLAASEAETAVAAIEQARASDPQCSIAVLVRIRNHADAILAAMRRRNIRYQCTGMEGLDDRQTIADLLALTRCLLHPGDRTAWLAALRAPWCGASLSDLAALCEGDSAAKVRTLPELFAERASQLSLDGQRRIGRTLETISQAAARTGSAPLWSLVERAWHSLGGPCCVAPAEATDIDSYFKMLAAVEAQPGVLTLSAIERGIKKLRAEATAIATDHPPVEVLTIHKAKGLEWDVVLLPGLGKTGHNGGGQLLNWVSQLENAADSTLQAGLLVAPIKSAAETAKSSCAAWIDSLNAARAQEELARVLYVAVTRARRAVHLFGRVDARSQETRDGAALSAPDKHTLLSVAWPAAESYFQRHYEAQSASKADNVVPIRAPEDSGADSEILPAIAAAAAAPTASIPLSNFRRLRSDWQPPPTRPPIQFRPDAAISTPQTELKIRRAQGSAAARRFGTVLHAMMEPLAHILQVAGLGEADRIRSLSRMIRLQLLRAGCSPREAVSEETRLLAALEGVARDPNGRWILTAPSLTASNAQPLGSGFEVPLGGIDGSGVRSIRVDRMYAGGMAPREAGTDALWIVDFKTAGHGPQGMEQFLAEQRELYSSQLEGYASIVSRLHPGRPILLGLYYPLLPEFLWWTWGPKTAAP